MKKPLISVVILTWNRKDDLSKSLSSIYKQTYRTVQVVIVDSNSTDGTGQFIRERYPDIKYILLPYNFGVIDGRNIGIANTDGDLIILLDDDAEFLSEDDFSIIVDRFIQEPELSMMYFKFISDDGKQWGNILPYVTEDEDQFDEVYTHSFVGCAHCIRSSWVERIGGLKKEYFREGEEQEFSYRTYLHRGRILYFPRIVVLHHLNQNQRVRSDHMMYKLAHRTENELVYLPFSDVAVTIPWRLLYRFWQALRERWLRGYFRGLFLLLQAIPRIIGERKERVFDRDTINLVRTLKCYQVEDYNRAAQMQTSLFDWIKVKMSGKVLGNIIRARSGDE